MGRRELLPSFTPLKLRSIERSIFFNCHASNSHCCEKCS